MSLEQLKNLSFFNSSQSKIIFDIITEIQELTARINKLEQENKNLKVSVKTSKPVVPQRATRVPSQRKVPEPRIEHALDLDDKTEASGSDID